MRHDRSSLNRAFSGALPATSLLLFVFCVPSLATATDIRCKRSAAIDELPGHLHVDMVDLARNGDVDTDLGRELARQRTTVVAPDLSSRARSMAILREIFGEPVSDDRFDVTRTTPQGIGNGLGNDLDDREAGLRNEAQENDLSLQRPAAGVAESDPPALQAPAADESDVPDSDARLPGVSEEESLRYRRQMYRTDI